MGISYVNFIQSFFLIIYVQHHPQSLLTVRGPLVVSFPVVMTQILFLLSNMVWAQPEITVSGLSSGAFMAAQMHVAHSEDIQGVAIIAGGPVGCAQGLAMGALFRCMQTYLGVPSGSILLDQAGELAQRDLIDPIENLKTSRVVIVTGKYDTVVSPRVVRENLQFYHQVPEEQLLLIDDIPMGHAFPTAGQGNPCEAMNRSPWVSDCGRDVAGEIFNHFWGTLRSPQQFKEDSLYWFAQPEGYSMDSRGVAYVPQACHSKKCRIHMTLHGCAQGFERGVGEFYFRNVGLNEWAEANDVIVIYPQAISTFGNPNQCWDWWGYLDADYLSQNAPQIQVLWQILLSFRDGQVTLDQMYR